MQVAVLASGSKGNATYVEIDGTKILVDAGISARRVQNALQEIGTSAEELDGILITHEHRDHIKGLATLCKKYHLPVYSRANTFKAMYCLKDLPQECLQPIQEKLKIGKVNICAFNISHDAAEPVGYQLQGSRRCTVATDLGFVTTSVQAALEDAEVLVLEANHDAKMLKQGPYPWALKHRILSNRGHLSNNDAAWALARLQKPPQKVFLAHLSEENNHPDLANETICKILEQQGLLAKMDVMLTSQDEVVTTGELN